MHCVKVCWQMPIDFSLCHVPEVPEVPQVPKKDVPQVPLVPEVPPTRNSLLATFVLHANKVCSWAWILIMKKYLVNNFVE